MKKELSLYVEIEDKYRSIKSSLVMFPVYKWSGASKITFTFNKILTAVDVVLSSVNGNVIFTDIDTPANTGTTITLLAATTGIKRYTIVVSGDDAITITNPSQLSTKGYNSCCLIKNVSTYDAERILLPISEIIKFGIVDFNQVNGNSDSGYYSILGDAYLLKDIYAKLTIGAYNYAGMRGLFGDISNIKSSAGATVNLPSMNTFGNLFPLLQELNQTVQFGETSSDYDLYKQYYFTEDAFYTKKSTYTKSIPNSWKLWVNLGDSLDNLLSWIATYGLTGLTALELYGTLTGLPSEVTNIATIKSNNSGLATTFKINNIVQ